MNAITKTLMTIEHHCLQLLYAPLRLHRRDLINKLVTSIEEHGQLVPVITVLLAENQWVLMDGYLRVSALRRLGKDTVDAEVWTCDPAEALLTLLAEHQSRAWETIEEALLLQELHTRHGLSQNTIAARIGHDQSWVSRRLSLLECLPESMQLAITSGKLSVWSAVRVLAPMARAIPSHGKLLLEHILKQPLSTRELKFFYDHYQQSNHQQRNNMVNNPDLFFKAQKLLAIEKQARVLQAGPMGKWQSQLHLVRNVLTPLIPLAANVFTPRQEVTERRQLIEVLHAAKTQFDLLTATVRSLTDAHERHTTNDSQSTPKGSQSSCNQPAA